MCIRDRYIGRRKWLYRKEKVALQEGESGFIGRRKWLYRKEKVALQEGEISYGKYKIYRKCEVINTYFPKDRAFDKLSGSWSLVRIGIETGCHKGLYTA